MRTLIRFLLWTALIVGLIVGTARATFFRWFQLPTNDAIFEASVQPTLQGGDWVLAWRLTKPRFGDLVVCPEPDYPERYVIGRIVGEAGDSVEIKDGKPAVPGVKFTLERSCTPGAVTYPHPSNEAEEVTLSCHWEEIANHIHKMGSTRGHKVRAENFQMDIGEGKFFLLSDNRLHPYDSRDFGPVDASTCTETIVGRIVSREGWMDSENRLNYIQ